MSLKTESIHSDGEEVSQQPMDPPDGGLRAWSHVLLCHLVFANTWGLTNSYGVFQQYYVQALGHSQSDVGWIGGIQMFLLLFIGVFSGRATDGGYFYHCLYIGVFLQVFGFCMASLSTQYVQVLLSQAVCVGIGSGLVFTSSLVVMSSYFQERRSLAVGLAATGASTGGILYPATANALLYHTDLGYAWTMRALALVLAVVHIPPLVGYRVRVLARSKGPIIDWVAFTEQAFVSFTAAMYFSFWGLYMAFYYLGTFTRERIHLSDTVSLLILLNAMGYIGRSTPCLIGERFVGMINVTLVCLLICAVCVYSWAAIDNEAGLYAWTVMYGLFAGAGQALFPAMATKQTSDIGKVGTRTGMILTIVSLSCLSAPAIQGALIQADGGSYNGAIYFSASSIVCGMLCLVWNRCCKAGLIIRVKV